VHDLGFFIELESDYNQHKLDAIRFNDFIKKYDVNKLPPQYAEFMMMDILHLTKTQIQQLGLIEYEEAFNYSVITYKLRSMASTKKEPGGNETITFEQPPDYDIDPNFISDVGN